jgi:hypothetical protein
LWIAVALPPSASPALVLNHQSNMVFFLTPTEVAEHKAPRDRISAWEGW